MANGNIYPERHFTKIRVLRIKGRAYKVLTLVFEISIRPFHAKSFPFISSSKMFLCDDDTEYRYMVDDSNDDDDNSICGRGECRYYGSKVGK